MLVIDVDLLTLFISRTTYQMIVDEASALHKSVTGDRAKETKAALFEIRAYLVAFLGGSRNVFQFAPFILFTPSSVEGLACSHHTP